MTDTSLADKRVLITQADAFMGPALCEVFAARGATVIASTESLLDPAAPAAVVEAGGQVEVLVVNLAIPALLFHRYFRGRVESHRLALEIGAERLLAQLRRLQALRGGLA